MGCVLNLSPAFGRHSYSIPRCLSQASMYTTMMVLNSAVVFGIQTLNSRWTEASQVGVDGDGDIGWYRMGRIWRDGEVAPTDCQCGILTTAHNLQSQIRSKSHGVAHSEDKCDGQTTSLRTEVGWGRGHWALGVRTKNGKRGNGELWTRVMWRGSRIQTDADTDARTRTQSRCVFGFGLLLSKGIRHSILHRGQGE